MGCRAFILAVLGLGSQKTNENKNMNEKNDEKNDTRGKNEKGSHNGAPTPSRRPQVTKHWSQEGAQYVREPGSPLERERRANERRRRQETEHWILAKETQQALEQEKQEQARRESELRRRCAEKAEEERLLLQQRDSASDHGSQDFQPEVLSVPSKAERASRFAKPEKGETVCMRSAKTQPNLPEEITMSRETVLDVLEQLNEVIDHIPYAVIGRAALAAYGYVIEARPTRKLELLVPADSRSALRAWCLSKGMQSYHGGKNWLGFPASDGEVYPVEILEWPANATHLRVIRPELTAMCYAGAEGLTLMAKNAKGVMVTTKARLLTLTSLLDEYAASWQRVQNNLRERKNLANDMAWILRRIIDGGFRGHIINGKLFDDGCGPLRPKDLPTVTSETFWAEFNMSHPDMRELFLCAGLKEADFREGRWDVDPERREYFRLSARGYEGASPDIVVPPPSWVTRPRGTSDASTRTYVPDLMVAPLRLGDFKDPKDQDKVERQLIDAKENRGYWAQVDPDRYRRREEKRKRLAEERERREELEKMLAWENEQDAVHADGGGIVARPK